VNAALQRLRSGAAQIGVVLEDASTEQFERYIAQLLRWRTRLNLTGAATPAEIVVPHLLDSLLPLAVWRFPDRGRAVDVGSGAGFPGVPIKLARPDIEMTLVEASRRRVAFLEHLQAALDIDGLAVVWGRAEEVAHRATMREAFDCAVERATSRTPLAAEMSLPFVVRGGAAILLKGPAALVDLPAAIPLIEALGGAIHAAGPRVMPGEERTQVAVVLRKAALTPTGFPRRPPRLGQTLDH
jgi:16S rRNA (guanine527-N7)-methyltransferase